MKWQYPSWLDARLRKFPSLRTWPSRRSVRVSLPAIAVLASAAIAACAAGEIGETDSSPEAALNPENPGPAGEPGGESPGPADLGECIEPACQSAPLPPSPHAVRLTHGQWENTVKDLLRLPSLPGLSRTFPGDPAPPGEQFGRDGGALVITNALWQEYRRAAETLADLVASDASAVSRLLPEAAKTGDTAARLNAFVTDFLPRAYRRPVTPAEIAAVVTLAESVAATEVAPDPLVLRVRWAIASVLQSPFFLYRVEAGEGEPQGDRVRLGNYELASKLSYALWGTMPDPKLNAYAAEGKLGTPEGLASVVSEMLSDPRLDPVLADFHDQLFAVGAYAGVVREPAIYPDFYTRFGRDAQEDVRRTIRDLVIEKPGGVKELYSSKTAYVNRALAGFYGIDTATVPELAGSPDVFVKVQMPGPRAGVLSHLGWLAMLGKPIDPSTILRGVYLARHLLCINLGSPPPAAGGKDPSQIDAPTNRQRVEGITNGCGDGCHGGPGGTINPLGFAFEGFDSLGRHRTTDNGIPVDTSGTIEGVGSFADAEALMAQASTNARTHACYAAHWSAYLNGIPQVRATPRWLSPVLAKSLKGASVREIIGELVQTEAFVTVSR